MDNPAALVLLHEFGALLDKSKFILDNGGINYYVRPDWVETQREINRLLPGVQRIAQRIAPNLPIVASIEAAYEWEWKEAYSTTLQLTGTLENEDRIAAILEPAGPTLAAAGLHPWVWQPVVAIWDDGHYRSALQMAATSVSGQLQVKLGRFDLADSDLVTRAFILDPPKPGDPRLRLPAYAEGSRTYTSAHEGAMAFGRGCMMAIRNLAVHTTDQMDEQVALEQLAAQSLLARWIDEATVTSV